MKRWKLLEKAFFVVIVVMFTAPGCSFFREEKPCTALAEAKATIAQVEVEAYTVQMEAYSGRAEEYGELREAVKLASRAWSLSSLTEESTEAEVCIVLAEEYGERGREATEWAEAWGVLAEEYERAYTALGAQNTTRVEDARRAAENARNAVEFHAKMAEDYARDAAILTVWFEEYTEATAAGLITVSWRPKQYTGSFNRLLYDDLRLGQRISSIQAGVWRNRAESYARQAKEHENGLRKARAAAEDASRILMTLDTTGRTEASIVKEDAVITRAWARAATEQVEAFTALVEAYTALSEEDTALSELSIALVAEAYTALAGAYTVQAETSNDQAKAYTALAGAYTALAEKSIALAER